MNKNIIRNLVRKDDERIKKKGKKNEARIASALVHSTRNKDKNKVPFFFLFQTG
jgi:hypothetical protein